jgi:hypothetical protein
MVDAFFLLATALLPFLPGRWKRVGRCPDRWLCAASAVRRAEAPEGGRLSPGRVHFCIARCCTSVAGLPVKRAVSGSRPRAERGGDGVGEGGLLEVGVDYLVPANHRRCSNIMSAVACRACTTASSGGSASAHPAISRTTSCWNFRAQATEEARGAEARRGDLDDLSKAVREADSVIRLALKQDKDFLHLTQLVRYKYRMHRYGSSCSHATEQRSR